MLEQSVIETWHQELLKELACSADQILEPAVIESCMLYVNKLALWTKRVDLVAPAAADVLYQRHVIDSIAAWLVLRDKLPEAFSSSAVVDVGSGAGLPGLIWALLKPDWKVYLVEPRDKRVQFLREMKLALALENLQIISKRVEALLVDEVPAGSFFCSRGLGLDELLFETAKKFSGEEALAIVLAGPKWEGHARKQVAYVVNSLGKRQLVLL